MVEMYRDDTPTMTLTRIPNPIQPHERLMGTNWLATDICGLHTRNSLRPVLEDYPITLSFSRDEVRGNAGCNQFSAKTSSSQITLNKFQVADVAITSMHCGQEAMSQERAFMSILENPGLQYTLSWEQVRGDEWTKCLDWVLHTQLQRWSDLFLSGWKVLRRMSKNLLLERRDRW